MEEIAYIKNEVMICDPNNEVQVKLQSLAKRMIAEMELSGTTVEEFRSRFARTGNMFLD